MTRSRRSRKKVGFLVAFSSSLAIITAALLGPASPASASTVYGCADGSTCLYTGNDYTKDPWQVTLFTWGSNLSFENCIDRLQNYNHENKVSSVYNNGLRENSYLYAGAVKTGARIMTAKGTGYKNLGKYSWDDRANSAYFNSLLGSVGTVYCK